MRTTIVPQQTVTEEIQSYDHVIGSFVRVTIGVGQEIDGIFQYNIPQQFDVVMISDRSEILDPQTGTVLQTVLKDYTDLSTQYPNGSWSTDDLWPYIDLVRSRR
jgi:hypothetical protein